MRSSTVALMLLFLVAYPAGLRADLKDEHRTVDNQRWTPVVGADALLGYLERKASEHPRPWNGHARNDIAAFVDEERQSAWPKRETFTRPEYFALLFGAICRGRTLALPDEYVVELLRRSGEKTLRRFREQIEPTERGKRWSRLVAEAGMTLALDKYEREVTIAREYLGLTATVSALIGLDIARDYWSRDFSILKSREAKALVICGSAAGAFGGYFVGRALDLGVINPLCRIINGRNLRRVIAETNVLAVPLSPEVRRRVALSGCGELIEAYSASPSATPGDEESSR